MNVEEKPKAYIIPQNYEDALITGSGIKYRNIIEGAALFGISALIMFLIPMPLKFKIIGTVILGGSLGALGICGINHCSLSEYLMLIFKFKSSNQDISSSGIFDNKYNDDTVMENSSTENTNTLERGNEQNAKTTKRKCKQKQK